MECGGTPPLSNAWQVRNALALDVLFESGGVAAALPKRYVLFETLQPRLHLIDRRRDAGRTHAPCRVLMWSAECYAADRRRLGA